MLIAEYVKKADQLYRKISKNMQGFMARKFIGGLKDIGKMESVNILIKSQRSKDGLNEEFIYLLAREAVIDVYIFYG